MNPEEIKELVKDIDSYNSVSDMEGELLYNLAKECEEGTIVEIGSWKGRSTIWLGCGAEVGKIKRVYAIDPHLGSPVEPRNTYDEFWHNIVRVGLASIVVPIVRTSMETIGDWSLPIELLWIDGAHEYEAVKDDLDKWEGFLIEGGIVAIHDTYILDGPRRVVKDIYQSGNFASIKSLGSITYARKIVGIGPTPHLFRYLSEIPYRVIYRCGKALPKTLRRMGWRVIVRYPPHSWRYPTRLYLC